MIATNTSAIWKYLAFSIRIRPSPVSAAVISATITPETPRPMPIRKPANMNGSDDGITIVRRIWREFAVNDKPVSMNSESTCFAPA